MRITVKLNGTDENPYAKYGLKCNPFPQIGLDEFRGANALLADLAANPIKDLDDLRNRLKGCTGEFIDLCCQRFEKGKTVEFQIDF